MIEKNLIAAASFTPDLLQSPSAWLGHLPFASWLIKEISPKIFVELGTHYGHSYFSFCQSVAEKNTLTKCYAVDTWLGDDHAGKYSEDIFYKVDIHNQKNYAEFSRLLRMTFDDAANYFSNGAIDLLHIDGLHTYEAVLHDFETWLPKLAPGAVVLFHDTNVRERDFGVWKLWDELKKKYPNNLEFFHSSGLGVLQINDSPNDKKFKWLQIDSNDQVEIINYFSALGTRQSERFELNELRQLAVNFHETRSKRDVEIVCLNKTVVKRDEAIALQKEQIVKLQKIVAERNTEILSFNNILLDRDNNIINLNQSVADYSRNIANIYLSNSWRLTWPLRLVSHQSKRVHRIVRLIAPAIKHSGGFRNTVSKAFQIFKNEGFRGIKRGLKVAATSGQPASSLHSNEYGRNDYVEWIRRYDTLDDENRAFIREKILGFEHKPVISVVMPTYNTKAVWLIEVIESVRKQIYPYWELCIADDASTDPAIRPILENFAAIDSRIKIIFRPENGHISAASNTALELVSGEWVALLDHDDLLSEHALFWIVDAINRHPDAQLIYSDEDKIDENGRRFDPYFKCNWNANLFYSHNLITHLGVYRTDIVKDIEGFKLGVEGAQDYDLALRFIERIAHDKIQHVPRILYHWRVHAESTAHSADAKPYAMLAGERALNDHFRRRSVDARAELIGIGYRIHYALPKILPLVTLIIPTRNGLRLIRNCLTSIFKKTTYENYEIIIVDNGSDDPATLQYFEELRSESRVRVVRDNGPFNYSALNNSAVKMARGELLGLLNNDLEIISPEWLSEMVSNALQPGVGAVGARLWYPDETLQHGGVVLGLGGVAGHVHSRISRYEHGYFGRAVLASSFSALTAACLIIKKEIFDAVGGLNEIDLKVAYNDVDLCLRVREKGFRNVWTPYAELYHHESATRGYEDSPEKIKRFNNEANYMKNRWGNLLLNDPAYSPNLTLSHGDFSLAWPPRI